MPTDERDLVIPSDIPWDALKGRDLEECLYWLLDDMGAKDLQWRQGGEGQGGTDQGRDMQATFYADAPDGELQAQRWWVESKGRTRTVEPKAVKDALTNTASRNDVDVIVVATNTRFSNPTHDWVADWQVKHPRPQVRLWDRESLERMVVKHPAVVHRLFSEALSPQGRLEAISSRFWEKHQMPTRQDLQRLWATRATLSCSHTALLALITGELCNGDIRRQPWLAFVPLDDLPDLLTFAIANFGVLLVRAQNLGIKGEAVVEAVVYVFMTSLLRLPDGSVLSLLEKAAGLAEQEVTEDIWPRVNWLIIRESCDQLRWACMGDCRRISTTLPVASRAEAVQYWDRFRKLSDDAVGQPQDACEHCFCFERDETPCLAGLRLDAKHGCPLVSIDENDLVSHGALSALARVLIHRVNEEPEGESRT